MRSGNLVVGVEDSRGTGNASSHARLFDTVMMNTLLNRVKAR